MDYILSKPIRRKNGTYSAYVQQDGKRRYVYAPTASEARAKQNELAERFFTSDMKLSGLIKNWLEYIRDTHSPSTIREWERLCRKHIEPELGDIKLSKLKHADVQKFISKYNKDHSHKSAACLKGVLHTMLEYARMNDLIESNPSDHIYLTQTPQYEYYIYSREEMKQLLNAVHGTDDELPIMLAAFCGLRMSEVCGLRWDDVDLDAGTLRIRQVALACDSEVVIKDVPKTKTSAKPIPIPDQVLDLLGKAPVKEGYVFPKPDGSPHNGLYYTRHFTRILKWNNLPHTRFHDLRHFVATSLMDAGLSDKEISEYMRHSDTRITARYQHIREQTKRRAADTMGDILG